MNQIQACEHGLQPFRNGVYAQAGEHLPDRMHYYGVPGVSIAVINDGRLDWARGYGVCDQTTLAPITPDTRFPVASLTKPIVALAILRLVQQGILDLDVDVNRYLTSWAVPDTLNMQHSILIPKAQTRF